MYNNKEHTKEQFPDIPEPETWTLKTARGVQSFEGQVHGLVLDCFSVKNRLQRVLECHIMQRVRLEYTSEKG